MNRFFPLFIMLTFLLLSTAGCKDKGGRTNKVHSQEAVSNIQSKTSGNVAKQVEDITFNADSIIDKSTILEDSIMTADELVKQAVNTKPTARVVNKIKAESKKTAKKPNRPKAKKAPKKYLPKVEFAEMSYDFGEIVEGDIIEYKFTFTNTGKSNLSIEKATASCGCTKPSFPFIDIEPGETGYIGVTYNSVNKDGAQKPEITVYSNAQQKEITLYLTGKVKPKPEKDSEDDVNASDTMPQDTTKQ